MLPPYSFYQIFFFTRHGNTVCIIFCLKTNKFIAHLNWDCFYVRLIKITKNSIFPIKLITKQIV